MSKKGSWREAFQFMVDKYAGAKVELASEDSYQKELIGSLRKDLARLYKATSVLKVEADDLKSELFLEQKKVRNAPHLQFRAGTCTLGYTHATIGYRRSTPEDGIKGPVFVVSRNGNDFVSPFLIDALLESGVLVKVPEAKVVEGEDE